MISRDNHGVLRLDRGRFLLLAAALSSGCTINSTSTNPPVSDTGTVDDTGSTADDTGPAADTGASSDTAPACTQEASCFEVVNTYCARAVACCASGTSCPTMESCFAAFAVEGIDCSLPAFSIRTCVDITDACVGDIPLMACTDINAGTAAWSGRCITYWNQF